MGSSEGNEDLSLRIADELGCIVAAPAYRLTPEHPYPEDLEDCYEALVLSAAAVNEYVNALAETLEQ